MLSTRTGSFPIGFRRGWSDWQKDLPGLIDWSIANDMSVIDLGGDADEAGKLAKERGIKVGTADLLDWSGFISANPADLEAALEKNRGYIARCAELGIDKFFAVMLPKDPSLPRAENYRMMIEGLRQLTPILEEHHAFVVIEGWPGPGALCCTPETYRATLEESSDHIGINFDPSHLIRMGIDPVQFCEEFASRIYHVHGKDTEVMYEEIYEFGTEQPATFAKGHGFGSTFWRYTIPGHGEARWGRLLSILDENGYNGAVCIELEDENFNGAEDGEKAGLVAGAQFLASA